MLPMPSPIRPAHADGFSDFVAHTIHWGDFPTWLAAIGGLAAAVYAARAFRSVARQQALNDRIMRYQAYSQARQMVAGVRVRMFPVSPTTPSVRRIELANESEYRISSIRLASLSTSTDTSGPVSIKTDRAARTLGSYEKAVWEVSLDAATADTEVAYTFMFTDEAGGSWAIDDQARLTTFMDAPRSQWTRTQRLKDWWRRRAVISRWVGRSEDQSD